MKMHAYKTLESNNHIRALILHPSQDSSSLLQCSIKQQELDTTAESYECISYTWGCQNLTHILQCGDGSVFKITANLHSALRRFRSNTHPRCLWADAVCINQTDGEEKSRQIPLMPRIYRNASRVLVWLGSDMDGETEILQALARLRNIPDRFSFASGQQQEITPREESPSLEAQASIRSFFRLPWFGRRWVVQEIVLNPDVVFYYGPSSISWPRLHLAISSLPSNVWNSTSDHSILKSLQKLGDLWRTWSYSDEKTMDTNCELFNLLDSFHHFECQEDKDRIYALAGLASDVQTSTGLMPLTARQGKIQLIPDYLLSDDEVFRQVALRRMQSGRAFTTLAYAGALRPLNKSLTLSSWTPDFRLSKLWSTILIEPDIKHQPKIELCSKGSLTLKANVCVPFRHSYNWSERNKWDSCTVHHLFPGPPDSEPRSFPRFLRECLNWMHSIPTLVDLEKEDVKTALFDVLLASASSRNKEEHNWTSDFVPKIVSEKWLKPNISKAEREEQSIRWLDNLLVDDNAREDGETKHSEPTFPYLVKAPIGRSFFMTKTITISRRWGEEDGAHGWQNFGISLLGIGPGDMEVGDVIARFAGMEQSLFFRPEDGRYRVLGDGYFTVLHPSLKHEFRFESTEILLV